MTRFRVLALGALLAFGTTALAVATAYGSSDDNASEERHIAMRDDCDPRDPAWDAVGGCALRRGDVTVEEFDEELISPLADSVIGHQAWRNDPSYLKFKEPNGLRVTNLGGRPHTFTEVAEFGGGFVPELNFGLVPAPECESPQVVVVPPGESVTVPGLSAGNHRFMCCIHPWMRALIKVKPED
jgi:hypothetical protein